jgi:hypothetical protein
MGIDKGILAALADHREKIKGPHFIFSADFPLHSPNNRIEMNHEQILEHLYHSGYDAHEIESHYGKTGRGIIVYQVDDVLAEQLHKLVAGMGQSHSIYNNGQASEMRFHHGAYANRAHYANDTDYWDEAPRDGYHSLPGNAYHFDHKFDYKNVQIAGQLDKWGKNVK